MVSQTCSVKDPSESRTAKKLLGPFIETRLFGWPNVRTPFANEPAQKSRCRIGFQRTLATSPKLPGTGSEGWVTHSKSMLELSLATKRLVWEDESEANLRSCEASAG